LGKAPVIGANVDGPLEYGANGTSERGYFDFAQ
jgi:hypothetical protein